MSSAQEWADRIQNVVLAAQEAGFMLWISDDQTQEWAQVRLGTEEDPGDEGQLVMEWKKGK